MDTIDYSYFFTAGAILVTVLALWAQQYTAFANNNKNSNNSKLATIGIFWMYTSTAMALISLVCLLIGKYWEEKPPLYIYELGFIFMATSFIMGLINIAQSIFSAFLKGVRNETAFDTKIDFNALWLLELYFALAVIIALIFFTSFLMILWDHRWGYAYILIFILGICEYIQISSDFFLNMALFIKKWLVSTTVAIKKMIKKITN